VNSARSALFSLALSGAACAKAPALPETGPSAPAVALGPPAEAAWPVPEGWQHERFALPPGFAPDFPLSGVEDLRFMPGFRSPGAPGHWAYSFVWWIDAAPGAAPLSAEAIEAALVAYFRGLNAAVGPEGSAGAEAGPRAALQPGEAGAPEHLRGEVHTIDSFSTGLPITLRVEVEQRRCPRQGQNAVVLALSPRPSADPVWPALRAVAGSVPCE
jgi:hypothetical protein